MKTNAWYKREVARILLLLDSDKVLSQTEIENLLRNTLCHMNNIMPQEIDEKADALLKQLEEGK